ncbi:TIR domain-containing protein [Archangium violaceum]|uniref:TIR domain-containing protein n=1 Tax=Archangium violaceum TaxID=83451 RepID=UPI002B31754E|nr:TIR domain-containing protein [Archangium gephyra]
MDVMDGFQEGTQTPSPEDGRGTRAGCRPFADWAGRSREIIDFQLERGRHEALLGREDVLAELDALLLGEPSRGWVLVKGGPGMGKSALLAEWLKRREDTGLPVVHHFLRRGVEDWDRPEVVKRNLAAQVEALYPELADPESRPESRLRELLQRVSHEVLVPHQERLMLVVDGLDEAAVDADGSNPIPRFLPHVLPPRVKVLCASRPTYPYLSWLEARERVRTLDLDDERWAGSNKEVVRRYWKQEAPRFVPPLTPAFVAEVVQRAEGNMLYAVKLAEWLQEQPAEQRRAELLPRGLEALLDESWERIQALPGEVRGVVLEGLSVVAVAREALPPPVLAAVAGWRKDSRDSEHFLRAARPFLLEEPRSAAWRPFHESFRSFILTKLGESGGNWERETHLRLAVLLCRWPAEAFDGGFRRSYALRHGVTHWLKAGEWEQARGLYTDLGYLAAKCQLADVSAVEEDLRSAAQASGGNDLELPRALHRAIQAESHWLRKDPKALPLLVYNRLRCSGWMAERIERTLHFPEGLPALRLRHPVRTGGNERTLVGHAAGVNGCAVTPDGRRVVSVSDNRTLQVWELETGRALVTLGGHRHWVNGCAVTPDGRRAVSASRDTTLKVWELETGRELATLQGHTYWVNGCAVTPDGRRVVSASGDTTLKVWELETGRELATLKGHTESVNGCAVTPDGRRVVSASDDGTLKVWELETGRELATLQGHSFEVKGCAVTPDGTRVVSASGDTTLKVWELETGRELATLQGHTESVNGCAVMPDGRRVVSASGDTTLKVWELETGRKLATLEGHTKSVNGCAVTPDGRRVVSASLDTTLKMWELETGRKLATLEGHTSEVKGCAVTPDGRRVVSASRDTTLKVWELETGRELATLKGHAHWVKGCAVTPDGRRVVSASRDRTLKVWELETGRELATLKGHTESVNGCVVTPDGRRVVSASDDGTLKVWELETGRELATLKGHTESVDGRAVTQDKPRAVPASEDGALAVWELETGWPLSVLEGHAPDDSGMELESGDETLKVWELESGGELASWEAPGVWMNGCAVTPDGRHVVSASSDDTLRVWELETGRELATLKGHGSSVSDCEVTPDGARVVSASGDKTLKVWALETGQELAILEGHADGVKGCEVTPDGARVVSASRDKTLKVWDIDSARCLHTLYGASIFLSVAATADVICAGDEIGNVWILEMESSVSTNVAPARQVAERETHKREPVCPPITAPARESVFISYSKQDGRWLKRLEKHLAPLVRSGAINLWNDTRIQTGAEWRTELENALAHAKVAVLLVSADFLASDFIARHELPPLLSAAANEGLKILWIPISASLVESTEISRYQSVLDPSKPLNGLPRAQVDAALVKVCTKIAEALT